MTKQNKYEAISIPVKTGIGLRTPHYQEIIDTKPDIGWFEIHSENYFGKGGKPHYYLDLIRQNYPLSFHGVGLSLGSTDTVDLNHLSKLKNLITIYNPSFVSEHLCWSSVGGHHLNDLLPLSYTEEALNLVIRQINQTQEYLNRQILIENVSTYLQFSHSTIHEAEFMCEIVKHTNCGILLDINNLYVNSINHDWNTASYLNTVPAQFIHEIHLAGFAENHFENGSILIDTHNQPVFSAVWQLYAEAIKKYGPKPTLIEWDKDIPALSVLIQEAEKANRILETTDAVIE